MRPLNIDQLTAQTIKRYNHEYLVWADGTEITTDDLMNCFSLTEYPDNHWNLEHKTEDFRIEDVKGILELYYIPKLKNL